jgi:hypothetical protein
MGVMGRTGLGRLRELASVARGVLADMARAGRLERAALWLAVDGAGRYAMAVMAGDVATEGTQRHRAAKCGACPLGVYRRLGIGDGRTWAVFCGPPPGQRGPDDGVGTCGCLVGITVAGEPLEAAGKVVVATEACPGGIWGPEGEGGTPPIGS